MNQTTESKIKTMDKEERALLLMEILKDLAVVEEEGYGRIVIEVKDHKIVTWWKIASRTARGFWAKVKGIPPEA